MKKISLGDLQYKTKMKTKIILTSMIIVLLFLLPSFSIAGDFPNPDFEDRANIHIMQEGNNLKVYVPGAAGNSAWAQSVGGVAFCTDNAQYLTLCGTSQDGYWGVIVSNNNELPVNNDFFNKIYNPLIGIKNQITINPLGDGNELIVNSKNEIISGRIDVKSSQINVAPIIYVGDSSAPVINLVGTINFNSGEIMLANGERYSKNNFKINCIKNGQQYISDKINLENLDSKGIVRIPFSANSIAQCNQKYLEEFYPGTRIERFFQGLAPQGTFANWLKSTSIGKYFLGLYSSRSDDLCMNSNSELRISFDQCSSEDVKAYSFIPSYSYMNLYASSNKKLGGNLCSISGNFTVNGQDSISRQCISLVDGSIPSFRLGANNEIDVDKLAYEEGGKTNYNLPILYEERKVIEDINNKYSNFEIAYILDADNINLIKTI